MNHNTPAHIAKTTSQLQQFDRRQQHRTQALQPNSGDSQTPLENQSVASAFSGSSARSRKCDKVDEKEGLNNNNKLTQLTTTTTTTNRNRHEYNTKNVKHTTTNSEKLRRKANITTTTRTAATSEAHSVGGGQVIVASPSLTSVWQRWCPVRPSTAACVTILLLSTTCSLCSASLCEPQSWWDAYKDKCIPCTVCQGDTIPLRPCQVHRDTVCGSIYDLKIDWVVLSKTEPNWKERRKFDGLDYGVDHHHLTAEQLQQLQEEADPLDWQTAALFLAVLACLLFFIVAACILVHHMRQWRRMERRLDQDVEELSTKLMAKLAEVQSLEGGTFFIGNADALRIPPSSAAAAAASLTATAAFHHPQHVMLPEKSDKHHHLQPPPSHHQHQHLLQQQDRRLFNVTTATSLKSGNVYIEENNSKC